MEFNDFNMRANNYNTFKHRLTFGGIATKSIAGLLIIAAIVCVYLFTGFSMLRMLPGPGVFILMVLLTFLQNFFTSKVAHSENKLGFWVAAVVCQGIFIAEFVNNLILIMSMQSQDIMATIGSLPAILTLAVVGTFALAFAGILILPYLLKHQARTMSFMTVFMRLASAFVLIMSGVVLIGWLFVLFGNTAIISFASNLFYGANAMSITISVIYLVISCGMYVMSLMAIANLQDQDQGTEWLASLMIVEIISLMFYYLFNILIQLFVSSDND